MPELTGVTRRARTAQASSAPSLPVRLDGSTEHAASAASTTGSVLNRIQAFAGTSFSTDSLPVAPPETQIAVSPGYVAEAVNISLTVWSRTGASPGALIRSVGLDSFFHVPTGYSFTDPRLVDDTSSNRWFLSGFAVDASDNTQTYITTSATSDPTGAWNITRVATGTGVSEGTELPPPPQ